MPQGRRRHKKESRGFRPWQRNPTDKVAEAAAANTVELDDAPDLYARKTRRRATPAVVSSPVNVSRLAIETTLIESALDVPPIRRGSYAARFSFNRRRKHKGPSSPKRVAMLFDETRPKRRRNETLAQEIASFNRWLAANGIKRDVRQRMILNRAAKAIIANPDRSCEGIDWSGRLRRSERPAFTVDPSRDGSGRGLSRQEQIDKATGGQHIIDRMMLAEASYAQWLTREDADPEEELCAECGAAVRIETTMAGGLRICCDACGAYETKTAPFLVGSPVERVGLRGRRRFFDPGTRAISVQPRDPIAAQDATLPALDLLKQRTTQPNCGKGKWAPVIEQACIGLPFNLRVPPDLSGRAYANLVSAMLRGNKRTMLIRWSTRVAVGGRLVTVAPIGMWTDAVAIHTGAVEAFA